MLCRGGVIGKRRIGVVSVPNYRAFSKRRSPAAILKYLKYAKRRFCDKIKEKSLLSWADFSLYPASTQIIAKR
jgi:hypothetical protein